MKLKATIVYIFSIIALPVIIFSCKDSIDIEHVNTQPSSKGIKASNQEIEGLKNWYSDLNSSKSSRVSTDGDLKQLELWDKALSFKQTDSDNKLFSLPTLDFSEEGKTKVKKIFLTEVNGKKSGFKLEINNENLNNKLFTGTILIMTLDEKVKREYKFKDNILEKKQNLRMSDLNGGTLPEVTVTAYVNNNGTPMLISLLFQPSSMQPTTLNAMVEPCADWGCGSPVDLEYDINLVDALIEKIRQLLLEEAGKSLNASEMAVLRTMSTTQIYRYYLNCTNATETTRMLFPNAPIGQDNTDHSNAFQHTYWSALHAFYFGYNLAIQLTNAHEVGKSGCNTEMDLRNNSIGANLGSSYSGFGVDLISIIYNMSKNGQLWTVGGPNCVQKIPF